MKVRFAVHIVIPVLILLFGLSLIVMQYFITKRFDRNSIYEEAGNHFRLVSSQILESADEQLGPNGLDELNNKLRSMRSVLGDLELAVVGDESGYILASTDSQQIKHPLSEFPMLSRLASQIGRGSEINGGLREIDEDNLMRGVFPFKLLTYSELGEHSGIGLIAIVLNKQHMSTGACVKCRGIQQRNCLDMDQIFCGTSSSILANSVN